MISFITLLRKEISRFMSMWVQTIVGPVSNAVLYQLIFGYQFSHVIGHGSDYALFIMPGLIMMQVLLNSFGNGSSSLILSKYTGNIVYVLMSPLSDAAIFNAYLLSCVIRGVVVGVTVFVAIVGFTSLNLLSLSALQWLVIAYFLLIGATITGAMGLIAGIICNKFDQISGFQSFLFMPLIYLGGIFFNIDNFPTWLKTITYCDPFLYIVDGLRFGFLGHSAIELTTSVVITVIFTVFTYLVGYILLKRGYNIKN